MRFFALALFLLFLPFQLYAQESEQNARLDIYPSHNAIMTGEPFEIAIQQTIRNGWHTYWYNAGDSGEPLSIEWDPPKDVMVSDLKFPTPKKIYYDPLVNYGYEGAPIYLQNITLSDNYKGDTLTLNGEAFWLVCEEICIPESQDIAIEIPVAENQSEINKNIFKSARAAMPQQVDWPAQLSQYEGQAVLTLNVPKTLFNQFTDVEIFPYDWGVMATTATAISDINEDEGTVTLSQTYGDRDIAELINPRFVLKTGNASYEVAAETDTIMSIVPEGAPSLILVLFFAFVGGIILNLMPCVFPVLSMKALSLVKLSGQERKHAKASGLAYTAGVVVSFLAIAATLLILREGGEAIGWGFQLQNSYVITALAALLFLVSLNLFGFFEFGNKLSGVGSSFASGSSIRASFFTGVLACLVATPCTAPFMATALGYAIIQPSIIALTIFAMLGFGLAFPYLILCFLPQTQRFLPKPGAWMERFRQFLAFPMLASVIWLIWVLAKQSGDMALLYILSLLLSLAFVIWLFKTHAGKWLKIGLTALIALLLIIYSAHLSKPETAAYEDFTRAKLEQTLTDNPGQPIFVNMTAAWCITCLVNERTSLNTDQVKQAFIDNNVIYMKGDWTNRNEDISLYLESYGRNGVPLYVYYGRANEDGVRPQGQILPQILTPNILLNTLEGDIIK
jgi:thiol:disulfide interchange protein DsbD